MAANPISDSGMTRRPFLRTGKNRVLDAEHQPNHTDAPLS